MLLCYFVDNCQLSNFVSTEMNADYGKCRAKQTQFMPIHLKDIEKMFKVRFTCILPTNIY